jgi:hypothetical protein
MTIALVHDLVMPGLVPGIHVLHHSSKKDVDGRDKPGHDEKASHFQEDATATPSQ